MKLLLVGAVGVVAGLFVAGCSSNSLYDYDGYNYGSNYGSSKATKSTDYSKNVSTVSTTKVVSLPPTTVTMPVTYSVATTTNISAKPVVPGVIQLPAAPVAVTNVVSITNKVEAATQPEIEIVNGQHRRAHLLFKGKATEEGFLKIVARKQSVLEDMRVIAKLYQEKDAQQQQFTRELQNQFGLQPDKSYQYDADAMTINEVLKPAIGSEAAKTKLQMKLKDEAAAQTFARLVSAKRLSVEQMASLQLMNREKQMEVAEYDRQLSDAYAIVKDRSYQYDSTTKTLYELIKLPEGVEMPKAGGGAVPVK